MITVIINGEHYRASTVELAFDVVGRELKSREREEFKNRRLQWAKAPLVFAAIETAVLMLLK